MLSQHLLKSVSIREDGTEPSNHLICTLRCECGAQHGAANLGRGNPLVWHSQLQIARTDPSQERKRKYRLAS